MFQHHHAPPRRTCRSTGSASCCYERHADPNFFPPHGLLDCNRPRAPSAAEPTCPTVADHTRAANSFFWPPLTTLVPLMEMTDLEIGPAPKFYYGLSLTVPSCRAARLPCGLYSAAAASPCSTASRAGIGQSLHAPGGTIAAAIKTTCQCRGSSTLGNRPTTRTRRHFLPCLRPKSFRRRSCSDVRPCSSSMICARFNSCCGKSPARARCAARHLAANALMHRPANFCSIFLCHF